MTATADTRLPQVQTDDSLAALRELAKEQILQQLNRAYAELEQLPEDRRAIAQAALLATWDIVGAMNGQWQEALALVVQQRDQAITELGGVVNALENADWNHPIVSKVIGNVYEEVMEQHNGAFWESLPYDVAHTLGGKWNFMEAQTLVDLIIDHDDLEDEDWAEEHGWNLEDVKAARTLMHKAIKKLRDSEK